MKLYDPISKIKRALTRPPKPKPDNESSSTR